MSTQWTSKGLPGDLNGSAPAAQEADDKFIVLLLYGKNSFGDKIYSYVKLTLTGMDKLKNAVQAGSGFNPSDFGTVIAAGKGDPSDAVRAEVASLYQVLDTQKQTQTATPVPEQEKKAWDEY